MLGWADWGPTLNLAWAKSPNFRKGSQNFEIEKFLLSLNKVRQCGFVWYFDMATNYLFGRIIKFFGRITFFPVTPNIGFPVKN